MHFADTSSGRPFSKDPAVVHFQGKYWMYYTLPPRVDDREYSIGIATSEDLENWQVVGKINPAAGYEKNGLCAPGALIHEGKIHLFYQTYGNWEKDAICHAYSKDGLNFVRNETNPIFAPTGDWTAGRAIDADVIAHEGQLYLFYATRDPGMQIQMLGVAAAPLDGGFRRETWQQLSDGPILKPELPWEQQCIEAPALCKHGDTFFMFYAGAYNNKPQQIGVASSKDLVHWQRVYDEPILPNGAPGTWNSSESGHPYLFTDTSKPEPEMWLFFQGNNDMGKSWYLSKKRVLWRDGLPVIAD
ncbi:MAG: glycoside hydrolase [Anaerolineaceae bacterium]|nr:glycoside hydrolase [Anaerolineaceae bacterium]